MNFVAFAGLVVAVLGLPVVWIAVRKNYTARTSARFDASWEYVDSNQANLRSVAWSASRLEWRSDIVPMLARAGWLMERPIALEHVTLEWRKDPPQGKVERRKRSALLLNDSLRGQHSYSRALVERAGKKQLFNGLIYRLVDVVPTPGHLHLTFTEGRYFDYLDTSEALAFELGDRLYSHKSNPTDGPQRRAVTDPFNLASRATSFGINTLTIRRSLDGRHGFFMHKRSGAYVVNESSLIHVVPAGEFAPSDISYEAIGADFSVWRNIMREYAEEFLNKEEAYGHGGQTIDYDNESPYAELSAARQSGGLRISIFGIALDALCLKPEMLTVVVIHADTFDRIFADMVAIDNEGVLIVGEKRKGIPFTKENIQLYADNPNTASAGAACLKLAWHHRRRLGLIDT